MTAEHGISPPAAAEDRRLALRIAALMRLGTVIASVLLAVGTVVTPLSGSAATALLTGGCSLLVLLPVIRLVMMTGHFIRLSDTRFALITLAVIALVVTGGVVGIVR